MSLTAVLAAWNSAGVLLACLNALKREGVAAIVVDNASADNSAGVAEAHGEQVIRNARNEGFGRAVNVAARQADTGLCLIINPDCVLEPGAIAALLLAADHYPDAAMFAPRLIETDGRFFYQNRSMLSESVIRNNSVTVQGDARAHPPDGDCCAPFLSGACLLVRREIFLALGGFDENIFLFYEDDDLCRRMKEAGHGLIHVHHAVARHQRGASSAPMAGARFRARWHMAWSKIYAARKHGLKYSPAQEALKALPQAVLSLLAWPFSPVTTERYCGTFAGNFAAWRGETALAREGLEGAGR